MSAAARLLAFAALLAAAFAAATLAGAAFEPDRRGAGVEPAPMAGHAADEEDGAHADAAASAASLPGLAISASGLTLEMARSSLPAGRRARLGFRIVDATGSPVTRFEREHERRMHVIAVRRDGQRFQHLHPRLDADGTWTTPIRLAPGAYRVFADFRTGGEAVVLGADLTVDGPARYQPLPEPRGTAMAGSGLRVELDSGALRAGAPASLGFTVRRGGRIVEPEPYLGAGGHLVALREGDLAYLHTHPETPADQHAGSVRFGTEFPTAGRYRLFFQFKDEGRIHTAAFTREVAR